MEFGMFHEFPSLPGRTESEAFDEAMEQVDAAERLGLDVMWLAELHFEPRRSVLSAPLSIASAIAARTRRMKIGIAVQVLPLCHPLRLAEEAATVDQLSHGRLIFGVGRSGVAQTYEAYGVSYAESRDRFREILDIIEQAWTKPSFSYDGKYHRFKDVAVVPKPYQKPTPAHSHRSQHPRHLSGDRPARRADLCLGAPHHLVRSRRADPGYHDAWQEAGHPGRGQSTSRRRPMLPRPRNAPAPEPRDSIMHFYHEQANLLEGAARLVDPETAVRRMQRVNQLRRRSTMTLGANALIGTADAIAEKLGCLAAGDRVERYSGRTQLRRPIPHQNVLTALQLLCEEVKPRLAR